MNLVSHNSALRCSYWLALALARRGLCEGGGIGVGVGVGLQNWRWRWRRAPELAERFKDIKASEWTAELWRASIPGTSSKRKTSTSQSDASNEWTLEPDVDPDIVRELERDEN